MTTAIAYTRRSTERQDLSHDAQLTAIRAEAERRGWELVEVRDDCSGSMPMVDRPGGRYALDRLGRGEAQVLCAAKLDRAFRSVIDGAAMVRRADEEGWRVVLLDLGMDTSTPVGRAMVHVVLAFAELELALISKRTKEGLAEAKRRGVQVGGPAVPEDVARRIVREHEQGLGPAAIARGLNQDGIPTARGSDGSQWTRSTVHTVIKRAERFTWRKGDVQVISTGEGED